MGQMNLISELLFPTFYTMLGALIGGIFAFAIAKRGFSDRPTFIYWGEMLK